MFSSKIEVLRGEKGIFAVSVETASKDMLNLMSLLNILNNVDIDSLRYRPTDLRDANKQKQVLVKQLEEQWYNNRRLVDSLVHPDCSYLIENVIIDNTLLRNNGVECTLADGEYTLFYLSNKTTLNNFISTTRGCKQAVPETMFIPVKRSAGRCNNGICVSDTETKGVFFLINNNSNVLRFIPEVENALRTGNLLLVENGTKLFFVLANNLVNMKG